MKPEFQFHEGEAVDATWLLTKRELFAGLILAGMLASPNARRWDDVVAAIDSAPVFADALLKALNE